MTEDNPLPPVVGDMPDEAEPIEITVPAPMIQMDIWVAWNEDGDYIVTNVEDDVTSDFDENIGGKCRRVAQITLTAPALTVAELDADVEDGLEPDSEVAVNAPPAERTE